MKGKIFRSSFFTSFVVLIVTVILLMTIFFDALERQVETELSTEARYIAHAIGAEGLEYFEGFEAEGKRITVIDFDGKVIYDTDAQTDGLDNHAEREEVKEAIVTGTGKSTRYSNTLAEKTVYYAVKLEDYILRISAKQYTVVAVLLSLINPIIIVLAAVLVLCLFLSARVSKAIIKPINNIDLENPEKNHIYEELSPLLTKVAEQKKSISNQISEAVRQREEFNLITENMSEGFLVIDKNTNLLIHNSAALKLLGMNKASSGSVLTLCRVKEFRDVVEKALCGEKAKHTMVYEDLSYRLIASPVFEGSSVIGAVIIIIDVTESENREALRREFTANVSHELKTPLTSISGFAELMKGGGTSDNIVVDFSSSIYNETQRLISLVNDIIKISELDGKSVLYENEEVDLYEVSREIIKRLTPAAKAKNVSLNIVGKSAVISGAEKIIDEMIYNLCDNAIKYNIEGGSVDIITGTVGAKVNVTVRDTGIGIPVSEQARVFERFYRVDKSHSQKIGGTGLGLAIVKHGAMYHNAEVSLESREGKGTSVTISFNKA